MVADATLEGSDRLVLGLKEINNTTKEMEVQEMELELRIHAETMLYQQQKD
jgi:hypothetical protein